MSLARIDGKAACLGNVLGLCVVGSGSVADPGRLFSGEYFWDARKAEKGIAKWERFSHWNMRKYIQYNELGTVEREGMLRSCTILRKKRARDIRGVTWSGGHT